MRRSGWLVAALAAVTLAACGGDDEPSNDEIRKPPLTVPEGETSGDEPADTTDGTDTTDTAPGAGDATESVPGDPPLDQPNPGNGGVPAPDTNEPARPPRDSPENDTPPEPGSPEERFEQFCEENPGAC